jgi:hypothetical protein
MTLDRHFIGALFAIGGAALLLLFVGIHNAWDTTTYVATGRAEAAESDDRRAREVPASPASERSSAPSPEPADASG